MEQERFCCRAASGTSYIQPAGSNQFSLIVVIHTTTYLFSLIGGIIFVMVTNRLAVKGMDLGSTIKSTIVKEALQKCTKERTGHYY